MKNKSNILITGSTGFVGSHLCHLLVEQGHQVYGLYRNQSKWDEFNLNGIPVYGNLKPEGTLEWVKELPDQLDVVIHCAGIVHSFNSEEFYHINEKATKNLVLNLKSKYQELHFINLSSLAAIGPSDKDRPCNEASPSACVSHYGKSKFNAEKAILELAPETWRKTIIRPPMIIGPHDSAILDIFKMVKNKIVPVPTHNGKHGKDFSYSFICVYDLVSFINLIIEKKEEMNQQVFFLAHPKVFTFHELIQLLKEELHLKKIRIIGIPSFILKAISIFGFIINKFSFLKVSLRLTPDKYYEIISSDWVCDAQKSEELTSFTYQWNLKETLKVTLKDYQKRKWI